MTNSTTAILIATITALTREEILTPSTRTAVTASTTSAAGTLKTAFSPARDGGGRQPRVARRLAA